MLVRRAFSLTPGSIIAPNVTLAVGLAQEAKKVFVYLATLPLFSTKAAVCVQMALSLILKSTIVLPVILLVETVREGATVLAYPVSA